MNTRAYFLLKRVIVTVSLGRKAGGKKEKIRTQTATYVAFKDFNVVIAAEMCLFVAGGQEGRYVMLICDAARPAVTHAAVGRPHLFDIRSDYDIM